MKVSPTNSNTLQARSKIAPPISLMRPEIRELEKGEYQTYKLRNTPNDPDSPTYELAVPYFSSGCVEDWLKFRKNLTKVPTGQNVTTGPAQYSVARRLLDGDALAAFENSTMLNNQPEKKATKTSRSYMPSSPNQSNEL